MLPIILTAPHGGRAAVPGIVVRRGVDVPQFTTERDSNTAELTELIGVKVTALLGTRPFLVVAHFERKFIDANRTEGNAFESAAAKPYYDAYHSALREALNQVRQRWGGGLLLDIHGQGTEPDTIFRGTNNGKSTARMLRRFGMVAVTGAKSILGHMVAEGYRVEPTDGYEQRYAGGYTTQTYGSHRALQSMRFSWNLAPTCANRQISTEPLLILPMRSKSSRASTCRLQATRAKIAPQK